jgi:hypothetical protein
MASTTRESAQRVVLGLREEAAEAVAIDTARDVLSSDLLERVFDIAWRHQFDQDRGPARRTLKQVVSDAVEEHLLERRDS